LREESRRRCGRKREGTFIWAFAAIPRNYLDPCAVLEEESRGIDGRVVCAFHRELDTTELGEVPACEEVPEELRGVFREV